MPKGEGKGLACIRTAKLRTEALVNVGRNYNGPKVKVIRIALVKPDYMRETPPKPLGTHRAGNLAFKVRPPPGSKNPMDMGTIRREDLRAA